MENCLIKVTALRTLSCYT